MNLGLKFLKNLVGFLGDLKTPKFYFEINWPLSFYSCLVNCLLACFVSCFFFSSEIFQPWAKKCARSYLCHRLSLMAFYCCECKYNSNAWVKKKTGVRKTRTIISTIKGQLCSQAKCNFPVHIWKMYIPVLY